MTCYYWWGRVEGNNFQKHNILNGYTTHIYLATLGDNKYMESYLGT